MSVRIRPALALGLTTAALLAGAAVAGPAAAPSCNLMVDDKGDAQFEGAAPNDPDLDIVSADIASDAKTVTAVLRLASLADPDPQSPLGRGYYVLFNAAGTDFPIYFNMQVTPDTTTYEWGDLETLATGSGQYVKKGDAVGTVDAAKGEIHISAPVADVNAVAKVVPKSKLSNVAAEATALIGTSQTPSLVSTVDDATSTKPYIAGSKSCVTPGK